MESLLTLLAATACNEQVVASRSMENGMQLLAYPAADGILVALGFESDQAHRSRIDAVLRRRTEYPERFASWLPALFTDGSWYVTKRLERDAVTGILPSLPADELQHAQELLS